MKQAFEKYINGEWFGWREIEVLPKCKRVRNPSGAYEYQLVCRRLFGLFPVKYWVEKDDIRWVDKPTVEYYDFSCGDKQ